MLRNQTDEDTVVKWAFFEVINHLKEKNKTWSSKWINAYLTTTKTHKILYDTFEKNNVTVTRSWYRYGCFIHSAQLSPVNFSALRNRFINTKNSSLRDEVKELGIQTEPVIDALIQTTDIMPSKVDDYIETLYGSNVPLDLGDIYTAKYNLQKSLKQAGLSLQNSPNKVETDLVDIRKRFSSFQLAAYSTDWFDNIADIASNFTTIVEQALLKAQELLTRNRLFTKQVKYLSKMDFFFDNHIWYLFALKTSAETAKGLRAGEIHKSQLAKQVQRTSVTNTELSKLSSELASMRLTLDWFEHSNVIRKAYNDELLRNAVAKMEELYDGAA